MSTEVYSPPTCPSQHVFKFSPSQWHHFYSVIQAGNWQVTFSSSPFLTQIFNLLSRPGPNMSQILSLCSIALLRVTITSHLDTTIGFQVVFLACSLSLPIHSPILYTIVFFSFVFTPPPTSYLPVLALRKSETYKSFMVLFGPMHERGLRVA